MNMKRRPYRQTANVSHTRWLAYATAGAATAFAASPSLEATIHYSGRLEVKFPPDSNKSHRFQLDQPGDSLWFRHRPLNSLDNLASFTAFGIVSAGFSAYIFDGWYVSKLSRGQKISPPRISNTDYYGRMAGINGVGQWDTPGVGFIGFMFNNGEGRQYGWARVNMGGSSRDNGFRLIDYAYGDPGEAIRAGEGIRADEDGQDMSDEQGLNEGSLGGLALGALGILAWRKNRSRTARYTKPPFPF